MPDASVASGIKSVRSQSAPLIHLAAFAVLSAAIGAVIVFLLAGGLPEGVIVGGLLGGSLGMIIAMRRASGAAGPAMERRWRRLGSMRGKLLTDADRQSDLSEALYRLEYRRKPGDGQSWLTPMDKAQAYDLQMPAGIRKRKGKPKRQRYG